MQPRVCVFTCLSFSVLANIDINFFLLLKNGSVCTQKHPLAVWRIFSTCKHADYHSD